MDFKSTQDVFEYAINKEKEAVKFYEELSKIKSYNTASETFERFANEERKHVKLFEDLLNDNAKVSTYTFNKIEDLKIAIRQSLKSRKHTSIAKPKHPAH